MDDDDVEKKANDTAKLAKALAKAQKAAGWSDTALVIVLLSFVACQGMGKDLLRFAKAVAKEEGES